MSQNTQIINKDQPLKEKIRLPEGKEQGKPRILVAPLDWGLGHATRCIPIIRELQNQGCDVWLAGEGAQEQLLTMEFPSIPVLPLVGYNIRYARTASGLLSNILFQTPRILRVIKAENKWLNKIIKQYSIDGVISDNRYGLHHPSIPCIFITHQLIIKTPFGKWTENILQKRNYRYINRFTACWVPDSASGNNLSGELSHPVKKPKPSVHYTGILSRFKSGQSTSIKNHLLVILSGPEPQRSMLEDKLVSEIAHYPGTATVVRGLPGTASVIPSTNMIKFYNHLPATELYKEIQEAEYVIGRCGYSTVMDLVVMKKKSILIPTPGQTEQEYLAKYLTQQRIACCVTQKEFSLDGGLQKARDFSYDLNSIDESNHLKELVTAFISELSTKKLPQPSGRGYGGD